VVIHFLVCSRHSGDTRSRLLTTKTTRRSSIALLEHAKELGLLIGGLEAAVAKLG